MALSPATTPDNVVLKQLKALQQNTMEDVFLYASPNNKANVGGSVERFGEMVRSGPYKYLINHKQAEVLLTVSDASDQRWRGLVRVFCGDQFQGKDCVEFWWLLSRCSDGPYTGSYMVDAVIPNQ
jgi:hypothetical protein